ncbi:MAG: hypothetical protein RIE86_12975 [Imperialibacter sp.]|uniref:hypothetical protein n=1 Tax=Imperialibacter sp. TaxID=2038411 RepID=UPI0032ECFBDB
MQKLRLPALLIFLVFIAQASFGQAALTYLTLEGGYYRPSLDYWNNDSYLTGFDMKLGGGLYYGGGVGFRVYDSYFGRASVGMFSTSDESGPVTRGGLIREEYLKIKIIPASLDFLYEFQNFARSKVFPYVGAGASINFIQRTYSRSANTGLEEEGSDAGRTNSFYPLAGAAYNVTNYIDVGLEVKFPFGSYKQGFATVTEDPNSFAIEKVSITGPIVSLKANLRFEPRGHRRSASSRYRGNYKVGRRR